MKTGDAIVNIVFYVFALAAMAGAAMVALSRNIVRSAFSLLMVLFSVAALYALAKVDFIFAIQVLVYVGGILVLIIFAVMLTHKIVDVNVSNESAPTPLAVGVTLCMLVILITIATRSTQWYVKAGAPTTPSDAPMTEKLGNALMGQYLYPFEVISVLLLVCLIGAAYLARKEVQS